VSCVVPSGEGAGTRMMGIGRLLVGDDEEGDEENELDDVAVEDGLLVGLGAGSSMLDEPEKQCSLSQR
jgi:hypothetical protein